MIRVIRHLALALVLLLPSAMVAGDAARGGCQQRVAGARESVNVERRQPLIHGAPVLAAIIAAENTADLHTAPDRLALAEDRGHPRCVRLWSVRWLRELERAPVLAGVVGAQQGEWPTACEHGPLAHGARPRLQLGRGKW